MWCKNNQERNNDISTEEDGIMNRTTLMVVVTAALMGLTACEPFMETPVRRPRAVKKAPVTKKPTFKMATPLKELLAQYPKLRKAKLKMEKSEKALDACVFTMASNSFKLDRPKGCKKFQAGIAVLIDDVKTVKKCIVDLRDKYRKEVIAAKTDMICSARKNTRLCKRPFESKLDYWTALRKYYSTEVSHWSSMLIAKRYYRRKCFPLSQKVDGESEVFYKLCVTIRKKRGERPFKFSRYDMYSQGYIKKKIRAAYAMLVIAEGRLKIAKRAIVAFKKLKKLQDDDIPYTQGAVSAAEGRAARQKEKKKLQELQHQLRETRRTLSRLPPRTPAHAFVEQKANVHA
ncbi:hypothetical protein ACFL3C_05240 [Patescibacteria group bacterium]